MLLARQACAESFHELERLLLTLMGEVEVDLGGIEISVAEQVLQGMQAGTALEQMGGEGVPQRVRCGIGQVEFFACDD